MTSWWRPPAELLAKIRWIYLLIFALLILTTLPDVTFSSARPLGLRAASAVTLVLLYAWWVRCYRRAHFPVYGLVLEAVAFVLVALAPEDPFRTFEIMFIAVSFRTLFDTWRHVVLFVVTVVSSFGAVFALTAAPSQLVEFLQTMPGVISLAVISYLMALALTRGARAAARERETSAASLALARAGTLEELEATVLQGAAALLPDRKDAVIRLHLHPGSGPLHPGSADSPPPPGTAGEHRLLLPVAGRDRVLATLDVDPGRAPVPAEARAALEVLTTSLGLSLRVLLLYEDMRLRAERDPLTGLANRDVLYLRLTAAVAGAGATAVECFRRAMAEPVTLPGGGSPVERQPGVGDLHAGRERRRPPAPRRHRHVRRQAGSA